MLSVILTATDAADVIDATVESVPAQTTKQWEMVIVDNGSTDDTIEHLRHWDEYDPRISVVSVPRTSAVTQAAIANRPLYLKSYRRHRLLQTF